jgi:prevent-host-death family protein
MKNVTVTVLRQNLPEYLAQVERGETLRVTVHGRAIAEISPPSPDKDEASSARARLHGSVLHYEKPLEPAIATDEWDVNR